MQAIDNCPPIQTVTERLVLEMIKVGMHTCFIVYLDVHACVLSMCTWTVVKRLFTLLECSSAKLGEDLSGSQDPLQDQHSHQGTSPSPTLWEASTLQ